MPYVVSYSERHNFRETEPSHASPIFTVQLRNPALPERAMDIDAHLDSGAEISVFAGWVPGVLGLDILNGRHWRLVGASGWDMEARRLHVTVDFAGARPVPLEPAFALGDLRRNLLGRDFFNLVQLGFRERFLHFYLEPYP